MKAIIPAAGHGTRFLPVTRAVPKEMLPIGAKPALEVIVDEAKAAGADEIVLVISPGKELIHSYFANDPSVSFVYQTEQKGLGHAVLQAAARVDETDGNVLVLLGDAVVLGGNASQELVAMSAANGGAGVIGFERVPREKTNRYGIAAVDSALRIVDIVEKPAPEEAPGDLAVAGRYLLPTEIFGLLATQTPGKGGEIQLTDAIRRLLEKTPVYACAYSGKRQDIGNPDGYYAALRRYHGDC